MPLILLTISKQSILIRWSQAAIKHISMLFCFPPKITNSICAATFSPSFETLSQTQCCAGKAMGPSWNLTMALLAWYCRYGVSCVVSAHFKNKLVISLEVSHILPNGLQGPCFAYHFFLASRNDFQLKAWHTAIISNNDTTNVCCVYENWFLEHSAYSSYIYAWLR